MVRRPLALNPISARAAVVFNDGVCGNYSSYQDKVRRGLKTYSQQKSATTVHLSWTFIPRRHDLDMAATADAATVRFMPPTREESRCAIGAGVWTHAMQRSLQDDCFQLSCLMPSSHQVIKRIQ